MLLRRPRPTSKHDTPRAATGRCRGDRPSYPNAHHHRHWIQKHSMDPMSLQDFGSGRFSLPLSTAFSAFLASAEWRHVHHQPLALLAVYLVLGLSDCTGTQSVSPPGQATWRSTIPRRRKGPWRQAGAIPKSPEHIRASRHFVRYFIPSYAPACSSSQLPTCGLRCRIQSRLELGHLFDDILH